MGIADSRQIVPPVTFSQGPDRFRMKLDGEAEQKQKGDVLFVQIRLL